MSSTLIRRPEKWLYKNKSLKIVGKYLLRNVAITEHNSVDDQLTLLEVTLF